MARPTHHTLKERTFLTRDGQPVPVGHPDATVLLGSAGKKIPLAQAEALGLTKVEVENKPKLEYPVHVGGGWYELSNGQRVKGRPEAEAEEIHLRGATT